MAKKSFFKERTKAEIKKLVAEEGVDPAGLVDRITDLDWNDAMILRTDLIPRQFKRNTSNDAEASRKAYKHGRYWQLSQPKLQRTAFRCNDIPLAIRARDFDNLGKIDEENNFVLGYSWQPVQGNDKRRRRVPFAWNLEGARLFAYAENCTGGISVKPYDDSRRVKKEGAEVICKVPSRQKKKGRYSVKLKHVPVEGSTERRAVTWSLASSYDGETPEHKLHNIRYTWENDREGSDVFTFYPEDIAAYYATIKNYYEQHNWTPIEMTPLALPSKKAAEFYTKLGNNLLIHDTTIVAKDNLRKLHVAEKSILLSRAVGLYGNDEMLYADVARDGKLADYNWQPTKD